VSDTLESKSLRALAVEVIISEKLVRNVFQPLFPLPNASNSKSNMLERIIHNIFKTSPGKGAIIRTVIGSSGLPEIEEQKRVISEAMENEVVKICEPLLVLLPKDSASDFRRDLKRLLENAVETWNRAQRSESRIEVSLKKAPDGGWVDRYENHERVAQEHADIIAVLFPAVYQTHTAKTTTINHGFTIWTDCSLVQRGKKEFQQQELRNRAAPGPPSGRVRCSTVQNKMSTNNCLSVGPSQYKRQKGVETEKSTLSQTELHICLFLVQKLRSEAISAFFSLSKC
jgi:hypothetical protein